ncbi:hypothetical protein [Winogradskyella flava]|uniref:Uncharacterized protein n=1 Tax=Winogradskyella flava TaxID=1884876 RepID=A0A842ITC3_9FLAO|nr:hypothetical protein [Winogradskyella flava]MBC2846141.1 hypothetical protein [Winogradskyella flava]
MTEEQTISWILMALAIASSHEAVDRKAISMVADSINHAVPTSQELELSIKWLLHRNLITEENKKYVLTHSGKSECDKAFKKSGRFAIWKQLEKVIKNYD